MPRNPNRNKPLITQYREGRHATEHEMIQIALLARKYAKSDGRRESSFEDMDRAWDEIKRSKNPNRPNGGRRTRRRARKVTKKYVRKNIRKSKNKKSRRSYRRKSKK